MHRFVARAPAKLTAREQTAWFMEHRLREAMRDGHFTTQLGGEGRAVEIDETFVGGLEKTNTAASASTLELAVLARKPCSLLSSGVVRFVLTTFRPLPQRTCDRSSRLKSTARPTL
jgi:hypothetical protein